MRSGERHAERGWTYLLLLFALALAAAGLAALGEQWSTTAQREREAELLFRGREIAQALAAWRQAAPAGPTAGPQSLQDLLVDSRGPEPRHHLRRLYLDPFTSQADWDLLRNANGGITAVASRSRRAALARPALSLRPGTDLARPAVGDWVFEATADAAPPAEPAAPVPRIERARRS